MPPFLITALILFIVWLGFLFASKETRKEQLLMSLVGLFAAPGILLIASANYLQVGLEGTIAIGIEDFIFSFSLFGIAAIIYHVLLGKHAHKLRGQRFHLKNKAAHWFAHLILILTLWAFVALMFIHVFSLSTIQGFIIGGLLIGIYIIADRHDLLLNALLSGLFTAFLIILVEHIFFLRLFPNVLGHVSPWHTINNILLVGIPAQELIWAATVGFTIGPMYEWLRRFELR